MNSASHRAVILSRRYHEAGVGIARALSVGNVAGAATGATFVLDAGMSR
jgi:uncharacterized protein YkwD